ncbi:hypothetical protein [Flagellimonas meishanensis]|uniref:hypothetical protein n=1 Tax=Flagellimonas meishanensis TaxID=2873264 RepID=UPI001CA624CF|nr:hypothetical protein [[Muricauda] meishanensis]
MKGINRIVMLASAAILTVMGYINSNGQEGIVVPLLCFLAAGLFLVCYIGKTQLTGSFSEIRDSSKRVILGGTAKKMDRVVRFQVEFLTFSVIFIGFGLGLGVGRTLYHLVNW